MSIGNVAAIRDWINSNYYSKQEIIDLFATEYTCNICGGSNEVVTITNTGVLGTVQTITLNNVGRSNNTVKIKALPGDTITLKGSISNQTFTHTFGLDNSSTIDVLCMPKHTLYWYGNLSQGLISGVTWNGISSTESSNPVSIVNYISLNRLVCGINNKILSSAVALTDYTITTSTNTTVDFESDGVNAIGTPTLYVKGENYCPGTGDTYKKICKLRIGETNNNSTISIKEGAESGAVEGKSFNQNIGIMTTSTTVTVTNFSKPIPPYKIYLSIQVANPASETAVNNKICFSEIYLK